MCLITGVGGLLGYHLALYLLEEGARVYGTYHLDSRFIGDLKDRVSLVPCDFLDQAQVRATAGLEAWDYVFHFAAQSLPSLSWREPELTFRVNVHGTLYLLDALRDSDEKQPRLLVAGSSAEYGAAASLVGPIPESAPLTSNSPYGLSKVAAELLADLYNQRYGLPAITVRPFFILGPGKIGDAASDFARGIVAIERGELATLSVGNLDAVRDFLDVRDAVRACWVLAQRGDPGQAYNLGLGSGRRVGDLLAGLMSQASVTIPVLRDESRMRPVDLPRVVADVSRLKALGWQPQVPLEQTLADILSYWRTQHGA